MARPTKNGLDYFPLDVNFLEDIKTRRIVRSCGIKSVVVIIDLLSLIYRDEGYYLEWNDDMNFLISDSLDMEEEDVSAVVEKALEVGFFCKEVFQEERILTSTGIQRRFLTATERRKENEIREDIDISTDEKLENYCRQKPYLKRINVDNNSIEQSLCIQKLDSEGVSAYSNEQSKVKESKVKESKRVPIGTNNCTTEDSTKRSITEKDINSIKEKWNAIDNLTRLLVINPGTNRYKMLRARINQYGVEKVLECIEEVGKSDFLKGYKAKNGWKAEFDWILKPDNFVKVLEGKYRESGGANNGGYTSNGTENTKDSGSQEETTTIPILDFS